ncbi:MAG: GFA family protein [Devosia sp.]|uniref:GFA family protein n=1 Tax=Devosia sp. TaxID=1871048 RepID=UPI0019F26375|nr:GFA family protein [Devosia sp.]MBF0679026.1 GFA family protein [Devosia sp.]
MSDPEPDHSVLCSCHCGAVTLRLAHAPLEVTHCNCSLCRRYGVLWAYYSKAEVTITAEPTNAYAWNGQHIDFHRCSTCGCVTHWYPRAASRDRLGINARLLDPAVLEGARVKQVDGGGTGIFY